jgi:prepilin signal peptidase PulO-like enzyme (type II secretory pathway)
VDNVPLLSYFVLRGRCRACGVTIPWRYPLVEALAVLLGAAVLWQLGPTWDGLRVFLLCLAMVAAAFTDLETRRIPDRITLPGVIAACILAPDGLSRGSAGAVLGAIALGLVQRVCADRALARGDVSPLELEADEEVDPAEQRRLDLYWWAAWGALLGRQVAVVDLATLTNATGPLVWRVFNQVDVVVAGCLVTGGLFFLADQVSHAALGRTGFGGGDVKLAGLIGAALGPGDGLVAAFMGIMVGGVVGIALLVSGRRHFGEYLPFGPFLAAGGVLASLWGRQLLEWHFG